MKKIEKETLAIHDADHSQTYKIPASLNPPIITSTSFGYLDEEQVVYPRYFNTPNQASVAAKIASLEEAEEGLIFSSGMAAITTTLLTFLKAGDHAIFQRGLYGGTYNFIANEIQKFGISVSVPEENSVEAFENEILPETKLIFIETPSNPLLKITDIEATASFARRHNLISAIDSTFASPVNQNPFRMGIDLVIHSATKYLGGHSDICAGAVAGSKRHIDRIRPMALSFGGSLDARTCYLLERSIKTLFVRVLRQNENSEAVAGYLDRHPGVSKVFYPGLVSSGSYEIASRQMKGFGGMLSFELKKADPVAFQKRLKLIRPAVSLGGVETIICSPVMTSHRHLSKEEREKEGITEGLLRLSVGIENKKDLIEDLEQALL